MAVTTVDGLLAALAAYPQVFQKNAPSSAAGAGTPHTPWYGPGITGAGSVPSGGLNGTTYSGTLSGQIPIPAAATGETIRIARLDAVQTGNVGVLWIVDRLWGDVPVVTTTTSQAITSPTWPARDASGSTSGANVLLALEASATTGNAAPITNTTVSYTDSGGTAGRTASVTSWPTGAPSGTFVPLTMTTGTNGVRSVQSITLGTSYVSGQVHLVAYRLIASMVFSTTNVGVSANWTALGLPTVWDNSILQVVYWPTSTSPGVVSGSITYAQG